jgi:hypothetical protein
MAYSPEAYILHPPLGGRHHHLVGAASVLTMGHLSYGIGDPMHVKPKRRYKKDGFTWVPILIASGGIVLILLAICILGMIKGW